jgi:murein DD-endopeptidase MepM/ murein hydrolase activator NlpD
LTLALALLATTPGTAWALTGVAPIPGPVVRAFDPPSVKWGSGHRGVDLLGAPGESVVAAAGGTVTYAAVLAGRGVLVISHGELRTTYEPVKATVKVGDKVAAGDVVGKLDDGHACPGGTCLHWGLKRGDEYLDPLSLLDHLQVRLLPASAKAVAKKLADGRKTAISSGEGIPGLFTMPTDGALGSPFGMRFHPIFHEWRMHSGVDIGGSCGQDIRAAAPGKVESVGYDDSGGHRLVIDHGVIGGHRLRTHYLHAQGYSVTAGQAVARGQVVGKVGSTGWSTGCHLHFSVSVDGAYVDPAGYL